MRLTAEEIDAARRCLLAVADGPFVEDWELETLIGVDRNELRAIGNRWPTRINAAAVANAFAVLTGYPHGRARELQRRTGLERIAIDALYTRVMAALAEETH